MAASLTAILGGCAFDGGPAAPEATGIVASATGLCPQTPTTIYTTGQSGVGIRAIVAGTDGNVYATNTLDQVVQIPVTGCPAAGCNFWNTWSGKGAYPLSSAIINGPDGYLWFLQPGINSIAWLKPSSGQWLPISTGLKSGGEPTALAAGPDGNVWFTWQSTNPNLNGGAIGIMSTFGALPPIYLPRTYAGYPTSIAEGPDGTMWFTDSNQIGQVACVTPSGQKLPVNASGCTLEVSPPINVGNANDILAGPDGNLWFLNGSGVSTMSTAGSILNTVAVSAGLLAFGSDDNVWFEDGEIAWPTGTVSTYSSMTASLETPVAMIAGPDGNMWLAENSTFANGQIVVVTPCGSCLTNRSATAVTIAAGGYPASVVSDGTDVYWTNDWGGGSVQSVPRTMGDISTLVPSRAGPWGVAVDANGVYWTEDNGGNGQVLMKPKNSANLVLIASGQGAPRDIALGNGNIYWTNTTGGQVQEAQPVANAVVTTLASAQAAPFGIAYWDGNLFWANQNSGTIMRSAGGAPMTFATGQGGPFGVATSADGTVVWTDSSAGTVEAAVYAPIHVGGYTIPEWLAASAISSTPSARNVVVDGSWSSGPAPVTYFTDFSGTVWYQTQGGRTCPLSTGESVPQGLYVDDKYVYWTDYVGSGVVRRANKIPQ